MSRRVGLRLVPDRVVDEIEDGPPSRPLDEGGEPDDRDLGDQPPALGATPAATPSE
jgi:hypothetical protein